MTPSVYISDRVGNIFIRHGCAAALIGTVDTLYIKFGDSFSASGWFQSGDTLFIDTLVTDSVSVAGWNFVNDSAGVAAFGFIAGAHTDSSNIKSWNFINDSTGIAAYGFVAGTHPDSVDKALKDAAGNVVDNVLYERCTTAKHAPDGSPPL